MELHRSRYELDDYEFSGTSGPPGLGYLVLRRWRSFDALGILIEPGPTPTCLVGRRNLLGGFFCRRLRNRIITRDR